METINADELGRRLSACRYQAGNPSWRDIWRQCIVQSGDPDFPTYETIRLYHSGEAPRKRDRWLLLNLARYYEVDPSRFLSDQELETLRVLVEPRSPCMTVTAGQMRWVDEIIEKCRPVPRLHSIIDLTVEDTPLLAAGR